jgi:hypothetical protein
MALVGEYIQAATGVVHQGAYMRIGRVEVDWDVRQATGIASIYRDQAARQEKLEPIARQAISVGGDMFVAFFGYEALDVDGSNPAAQMYEYVKQLPQWEGWEDT